jgi:hypothetical protein
VDEILKAGRQAGISKSTLERAKSALEIVSHKSKVKDGKWVWEKTVTDSEEVLRQSSIYDDLEAENLKILKEATLNTFEQDEAIPTQTDTACPVPVVSNAPITDAPKPENESFQLDNGNDTAPAKEMAPEKDVSSLTPFQKIMKGLQP